MEQYPQRKQNRLQGIEYSESGAYFITICAKDRANLFWNAPSPNVGAALRRPPADNDYSIPKDKTLPCVDPAETALRRWERSHRPPECLNTNGHAVQREIDKFPDIYHGAVTVDNCVIMPNHVHVLLSIHREILGGRRNAAPTIPSIVNQFKGSVTKAIGSPCWQKSFHDHVIRNEDDYRRIWEYIDANPGKWAEDRYYIDLDD